MSYRTSNNPLPDGYSNPYGAGAYDFPEKKTKIIPPGTQSRISSSLTKDSFAGVAKKTSHVELGKKDSSISNIQHDRSSGVVKFQEIKNPIVKKSLGKVEAFFLKAFSQIFPDSFRQFVGIRSLEERTKMHDDYLENKLGPWLDDSKVASDHHLNSELKVGDASEVMKVGKELFVAKQKLSRPEGISSEDSHQTVAKLAVKNKTHNKINDPNSAMAKMETYSIVDGKLVRDEGVVPTSYNLGDKEKASEDHLTNVYVTKPDGGKIVIRSGRIDSQERADDFIKIIEDLHKRGKIKPPLRMVSEQLNSFENEAKMIEGQHGWIAYAQKKLNKSNIKTELVHINLQSNRWVHATQKLDSLNLFGAFIKAISPKNLFKGEDLSRNQNLDSWGTYVGWVMDDLRGDPSVKGNNLEKLKEIRESNSQLQDLANDYSIILADCKAKAMKAESAEEKKMLMDYAEENAIKPLKDVRKALKANLTQQYEELKKIEASVSPGAMQTPAMQNVILMRKILGSQLKIAGQRLDRGQEGMMIQSLNDALGVITAMNCKSGLDRTGIWHAAKLALSKQSEVIGSERAFTLVNEWESTTNLINRFNAISTARSDIEGILVGNVTLARVRETEFGKLFPPDMTEDEFSALKVKIGDVINFRKEVLKNLIEIGIPITTASTGVMGLKWNSGMQENLLPLNFLPSKVDIDGQHKVRLVKYDSNGEIAGISTAGRTLLTKFQKLRGS